MGFDLIGMKIDTEHEGDTTPVFPVSVVMNGVSYDSLEDYLESRGIPGNSIKFSCSNRNWYTIWSYINFINAVSEDDFEAGNSNSGHLIDGEKSINIFNIHKDNNDLDKYLEQECAWADDDAKIDISSMINRFMIFCKKSEGFLIL